MTPGQSHDQALGKWRRSCPQSGCAPWVQSASKVRGSPGAQREAQAGGLSALLRGRHPEGERTPGVMVWKLVEEALKPA